MLFRSKDVEYESNVVMIKPEESIFFYTDGITEAFNNEEEQFNESRLVNSLLNNNSRSVVEIVSGVISDVQSFSNGGEQSDDITCLALKFFKQ